MQRLSVLRNIAIAPRYVRVTDLHCDLDVEMVTDTIKRHAAAHANRLKTHINEEASIQAYVVQIYIQMS